MGNVAITIRNQLVGSTAITDLVSADNIFVSNSPKAKASKQIVIRETAELSEPVLPAEHSILTLMVFVNDTESGPYAKTREIVDAILTLLNKKNETLIDEPNDVYIRWFLKTGIDFTYNEVENYHMAVINFDVVEGE